GVMIMRPTVVVKLNEYLRSANLDFTLPKSNVFECFIMGISLQNSGDCGVRVKNTRLSSLDSIMLGRQLFLYNWVTGDVVDTKPTIGRSSKRFATVIYG
uniref:Polyprotein n=1 Tax=Haemonchus contortus TaxID=6289 RepID=A0A7I5E9J5_HAECO